VLWFGEPPNEFVDCAQGEGGCFKESAGLVVPGLVDPSGNVSAGYAAPPRFPERNVQHVPRRHAFRLFAVVGKNPFHLSDGVATDLDCGCLFRLASPLNLDKGFQPQGGKYFSERDPQSRETISRRLSISLRMRLLQTLEVDQKAPSMLNLSASPIHGYGQ